MSTLTNWIVIGLIMIGVAHDDVDHLLIGTKVVTKRPTTLKDENRVVDDGRTFRVYTVDQLDGQHLWLVAGEVRGWVRTTDVVPFADAVKFYSNKILNDADDVEAYIRRGLIWNEKKDWDHAIADYDAAIRLDPNSATAYLNRGNSRYKAKDCDHAIADYDAAIRLDPNSAAAHLNRGDCWYNKKDWDHAIADYDAAIRLAPNSAYAYLYRGVAWYNKKDWDHAIADYDAVIRLDPNSTPAYLGRGHAWYVKRNWDHAIADYDAAIRLDPNSVAAYDACAWLLATSPTDEVRDGKRAIQYATKACELSSWKEPEYLDSLAAAHAEVGDYPRAVQRQEEALRLESTDSSSIKPYQDRLSLQGRRI